MAMRDIGSRAPHLKAMGRPKALGSRRSGRAGEPPEGVGKPCRCPASPRHALLVEGLGKPSLWVIISEIWYEPPEGRKGGATFPLSGSTSVLNPAGPTPMTSVF